MLIGKPDLAPALFITTFEGYGDLLYHTPTIRILSKIYPNLDVWCKRAEPFLNNPHIRQLTLFEQELPFVSDRYESRVFRVSVDSLIRFPHCNIHTVDLVSIKALRCTLRDKEKTLEAYWTLDDLQHVQELLARHPMAAQNKIKEGKFVVLSPAITWASRTLPLSFYQEFIAEVQKLGYGAVLVGKNVTYTPGLDIDKTLYPEDGFPGAISLYNQLTFAQLCALYSIAPIAINTENGNNPISCTNDFCWNLYIPTLTAPEYRLPYRQGSQRYRTAIAANEEDYYPASVYGHTGVNLYTEMPVVLPTVEQTIKTLQSVIKSIDQEKDFIFPEKLS